MAHHKSADPSVFILPDLGEGVHEAELIRWRVKVGDAVKEHDILAEMETDKALVEVPSPRDGVIAVLHGAEGEILHVGNPLVTYEGAGVSKPPAGRPADAEAREAVARANVAARADSSCDMGAQVAAHAAGTPNGDSEDAGTVVGTMSGAAAGISAAPGRSLATPAVRRLARDLGVDVDSIAGTGIGGRVTEKDVRAASSAGSMSKARSRAAGEAPRVPAPVPSPVPARAAARPAAPAAQARPAPQGEAVSRIPFRGVRRTIAGRLRESVDRAVHFNVMDEADVTVLDGLRRTLASASGEKVSFLPFVASAVCRVLTDPRFRAMNSTVEEPAPGGGADDSFILQHRAVHLGIATDTDTGLMVPVIRDADALGVLEIARAVAGVSAAARDRSIAREQLLGSTFTISNVGSHAGRFATPIINYPEVGILAVGRGRAAPVIRQTAAGPAFAVGQLLPLSLACDHRVVDGATAALALARIIELLQDPEPLLAPARK